MSILIHDSFPFLAFTQSSDVPYLEIEFCEWPEFCRLIYRVADWQVLPTDFLNQPVTMEITEALSPAERSEMLYWKPKKIGDVIFNSWD